MRKQLREVHKAYELIKPKAKKFVEKVDLITAKEFEFEGENSELLIWRKSDVRVIMLRRFLTQDAVVDMKKSLNEYLEDLEESEVRSLAEIIEYNKKHADVELPPSKNTTSSYFIQNCLTDNIFSPPKTRLFYQV